ncbi:MAG: diguanylate cyclase domain-containing protein, partial [Wenzhouxiangella sp.]
MSLSLAFLFSRRLKDLAIKAEVIRGELAESEARYRLLAENATDVIWTVRLPDLAFTYVSPSITRLRGLSVEQAMAETFPGSVVPEQRKAIRRLIRNRIKRFERGEFNRPEAQRVEVRQQCVDGREITVEIIATLIVDENNTVTGIQGISRNVTARKQAEMGKQAREAILSALAQAARLLFSTNEKDNVMGEALAGLARAVGADRVYVFENHTEPQTGELLASMRYEWVGPGVEPQIPNPEMQGMNYCLAIPDWYRLLEGGEPVHGVAEDQPDVERSVMEAQSILSILIVPIFIDGLFWGMIGFDDCTRDRAWSQVEIDALGIAAATIGAAIRGIQAEQELQYLVSTDSLTGLCSRRIFMEEAQAAHRQALEQGHEMGLLIMDLDNFKQINDTYGHPVGDGALRAFAGVCRQALRDDDLIGRM